MTKLDAEGAKGSARAHGECVDENQQMMTSEKWERLSSSSTTAPSESSKITEAAGMAPIQVEPPVASFTPLSKSAKMFVPRQQPTLSSMVPVMPVMPVMVVPKTWRSRVPADVVERFFAVVVRVEKALANVMSSDALDVKVQESSSGWVINVHIVNSQNIHAMIKELLLVTDRALPRHHNDPQSDVICGRTEPLKTEPGFTAWLMQGQRHQPLKKASQCQSKHPTWQATIEVSILLG
jgi:hypothetical protein